MKRYEQYAQRVATNIEKGVFRAGDRLPSVREVSRAQRIGVGTVQRAYRDLEDRGLIESRPRSGYFVNARWKEVMRPVMETRTVGAASPVLVRDLLFELMDATRTGDLVPLGSAFPGPELFPMANLARALHVAARQLRPQSIHEYMAPGTAELRRLIARHYAELGCDVPVEEIIITTGALEGLNLCLDAVTVPGDYVAIERPAFYAGLLGIERLGLHAVEISTDPVHGMNLVELEAALEQYPIKACWVMTSFQNPLGSLMPEVNRQRLVELLAVRQIPLIEDDVYGELYFGQDRLRPAKAFDKEGLVLHCSSYSKCLAPGYRVGWASPGRFAPAVLRRKILGSIATSAPTQAAIVEYLKHGGYRHHLRTLRNTLRSNRDRMLRVLNETMPRDIRVTHPEGGYFLWIEMSPCVDALRIHRDAIKSGITVAPGQIFSAQNEFTNCLRLNFGQAWTPRVESALRTLGKIVSLASRAR